MKPTIDPISGMPYLSHVNDIETIAALRAENERLKAESLADGLPASWWMNTALTQAVERNEDEERLRAEIERLTDILISCCNAAGGQAVRGVSVDFLAHVPVEIAGRIDRLTREREEVSKHYINLLKHRDGEALEFRVMSRELSSAIAERDQLREQLAAAHTRIEELQNVVQVAAFALAKREPEPLTETRTK